MNTLATAQRTPARPDSRRRRGSVMFFALVCMLIVVSLVGMMLQVALRTRRQVLAERDLRQTEFLLQAGAERAAYRLTSDADFREETWIPPGECLAGRGRVVIKASRSLARGPWQVDIIAQFPLEAELRLDNVRSVHRSRTFHFSPSTPKVQE